MVRGGQTRTGGADEARIIWTGLERAFKDVQKEGKGVAMLEKGLLSTNLDDTDEEEIEVVSGLLELAKEGKEGLDGVTPTAWFWRETASGLDRRLRDACRSMFPVSIESVLMLTPASPFLARTLKAGYSRLQSMVREAVVGSRDDVDETYIGPEVVLMLQSITSVQQIR